MALKAARLMLPNSPLQDRRRRASMLEFRHG
jgi:hypothetical protein